MLTNQNIPKHLNNSNKDNKLHFKIQYISSTHKHSNIVYKSSKITNLNNYSITHFKLGSRDSYIKFLNTDITNTENVQYTQITVKPWRKVFLLHLNPSQGQQTLVLRERSEAAPGSLQASPRKLRWCGRFRLSWDIHRQEKSPQQREDIDRLGSTV